MTPFNCDVCSSPPKPTMAAGCMSLVQRDFNRSRISVSNCSCLVSAGVFSASFAIIRPMARIARNSTKAMMTKLMTMVKITPSQYRALFFRLDQRGGGDPWATSGMK